MYFTFVHFFAYSTHQGSAEHPYHFDRALDAIKLGPSAQPRSNGNDSVYLIKLLVSPNQVNSGTLDMGVHGMHAVNIMDNFPVSFVERVDLPTTDGLKHDEHIQLVITYNRAQLARLTPSHEDRNKVFVVSTNSLAHCSEFLGIAPHPNDTYLNMDNEDHTLQRIGSCIYAMLTRFQALTIKAITLHGCTSREVFEQLRVQSIQLYPYLVDPNAANSSGGQSGEVQLAIEDYAVASSYIENIIHPLASVHTDSSSDSSSDESDASDGNTTASHENDSYYDSSED